MSESDDFYTPEHVDEQVDALLHTRKMSLQDQHMAQNLRSILLHLIEEQKQADAQVLQRVLQKILNSEHFPHEQGEYIAPFTGPILPIQRQERLVMLKKAPKSRPFARALMMLAAVLVVAVLVGSMVLLLHAAHQPSAPTASDHTATPTSTHAPTSTTTSVPSVPPVYTSPATSLLGTMAWSPNGQRIATLSTDDLEIWDATTGGHPLKVPVSSDRTIGQIAWSPDGQWIALATIAEGLVIVNSQTGQTVYQFSATSLAYNIPAQTGSSLSATLPDSGFGTDITGLAWSSNSQMLAFSESAGPAGSIVFLNTRTHTLVRRIPVSGYVAVANWSPDDKYLAANVDDSSGVPAAWVWNMSSYQVVFKQKGGGTGTVQQNAVDQLVWQPQSDNLAFAVNASQVTLSYAPFTQIEVWDVPGNKLLKQYVMNNEGLLAWSLDGSSLATVIGAKRGTGKSLRISNSLVIIDSQSGQQSYNYAPDSLQPTSYMLLAWSPAGKYIATLQYSEQNPDYTDVMVWGTP